MGKTLSLKKLKVTSLIGFRHLFILGLNFVFHIVGVRILGSFDWGNFIFIQSAVLLLINITPPIEKWFILYAGDSNQLYFSHLKLVFFAKFICLVIGFLILLLIFFDHQYFIVIFLILSQGLKPVINEYFNALQDVAKSSVLPIILSLNIPISLIYLMFDNSVFNFLYIYVLSDILIVLIVSFKFLLNVDTFKVTFLRVILTRILPIWPGSFVQSISSQGMKLLVGGFLGPSLLSYYGIIKNGLEASVGLYSSVLTFFSPSFIRESKENNSQNNIFLKLNLFGLAYSFIFVCGIYLLEIIAGFEHDYLIVLLFGLQNFLRIISGYYGVILYGNDKNSLISLITFIRVSFDLLVIYSLSLFVESSLLIILATTTISYFFASYVVIKKSKEIC